MYPSIDIFTLPAAHSVLLRLTRTVKPEGSSSLIALNRRSLSYVEFSDRSIPPIARRIIARAAREFCARQTSPPVHTVAKRILLSSLASRAFQQIKSRSHNWMFNDEEADVRRENVRSDPNIPRLEESAASNRNATSTQTIRGTLCFFFIFFVNWTHFFPLIVHETCH